MDIAAAFWRKAPLFAAFMALARLGLSQPIAPCIPANTPPADDCFNACWYGQTQVNISTSTTAGYLPSAVPQFCGSIENDQWYIMQAATSTGSITVTPSNCTDGNGVQVAVYPTCGGPIIACNEGCSGCGAVPVSITTNLVPGQFYYVLVDGWAGDACNFSINTSGFSEVNVSLDSATLAHGRVVLDGNLDCLADSSEAGLHHWLIEQTGTPPRYTMTDANGEFNLYGLEPGQHSIVLHPPVYGNTFWEACADTIDVFYGSIPDTAMVDFEVQKLITCQQSLDEGYLSAWGRRPCNPTYVYANIQNYGNSIDTLLEFSIVLDPLLTLDSTSIPVFSQSGDTLNFVVSTLDYGQFLTAMLFCHLPCDTSIVGLSFCNELIVYNPTPCDTAIGWSGASLKVAADCLAAQGEARFSIKNDGTAPTTKPLPYIVIEDEIVLKTGTLPSGLGPGQTMDVFQAATGKTLRLQVDQETNHPGHSHPSAFVEGCNGPVSPGFANQFAPDDADPEIDIDCHTITLSQDPNQKTAVPTGYLAASHWIRRGDEIEYTIDFHNTGTDTAFLVEIRDTISPSLDLSTLRMAGASHPFDWEIFGTGVLRVWFPGIKLVDSATNDAAARGFARFRIGQKPGLALGTQIYNRAAIKFDINAPVLTNRTFHTIGEDFLKVVIISTGDVGDRPLKVSVYPNPFHEKATLEITPAPSGEKVLRVFTPDGRTCRTAIFYDDRIEIERAGLPGGMLFFSIEKTGTVLAKGKFLPE